MPIRFALPFSGRFVGKGLLPTALRWVVTHCPCRAEENWQSYWIAYLVFIEVNDYILVLGNF
ncbi:MAG: hypothetical protein LBK82_11695 [Planctomycetaceae bacterium]|nr:hypothetical protein [Planctomycetaceae bacterium]